MRGWVRRVLFIYAPMAARRLPTDADVSQCMRALLFLGVAIPAAVVVLGPVEILAAVPRAIERWIWRQRDRAEARWYRGEVRHNTAWF